MIQRRDRHPALPLMSPWFWRYDSDMLNPRSAGRALLIVAWVAVGLAAVGCKKAREHAGAASGPVATPSSPPALELVISYGSEKKTWLEAELSLFNESQPRLANGRLVHAVGRASGSGEAMTAILEGADKGGTGQPHVFSPASGAYVALLNQSWQSRPGHLKPIAQAGEPLLLSPLVIAMWKPMAEALGWPERELGWADILKVARDPRGWGSFERPEWGAFKLGHTSPEFSTSGLLSILAIAAAARPGVKMTGSLVADPAIKTFLAAVQESIVHYGKSTGFFADKMIERGPTYLSAAVLYENLVIESYARATPPELPLVAIYPVEGTFWADHPFAVLDAPWVSAEHKEAAALLQKTLRGKSPQARAVALGFRAADPAIPIGAPIDSAHGVDPKQPQNLLEVPDAPTLMALIELWRTTKKSSDVVLVFDKSGSMRGRPLAEAKQGAKAFLAGLDPRDQVTLIFFDGNVYPPIGPLPIGANRQRLDDRIDGVMASGGTAMYDAIDAAMKQLRKRSKESSHRIRAVVAMTDGLDENSRITQAALRSSLGGEESRITVFTVGYGDSADAGVLTAIANSGNGGFARGDVASIVAVFRDLAAYF
jgi:Ca-activated chloride channel homolog